MNDTKDLTVRDQDRGTTALARRRAATLRPYYESTYDNEAWEVAIRLPGMKKENVEVALENEILDVKASRSFEVPEGWRPLGDYPSERNYRLRLDVGPEVDEGGISAEFDDGVLTLRLPLREEAKRRSIEVK